MNLCILLYYFVDDHNYCYDISPCSLFSPLSLSLAPPLTLDNVWNVVKNVRSWRTLGRHIYFSSLLDAIQRQHVSDEACLKAVIEKFLSGRGCYRQPSWRALIWSLYEMNELQLAEHIRSFAEPVQGNEFTIDAECVSHDTGARAGWVW